MAISNKNVILTEAELASVEEVIKSRKIGGNSDWVEIYEERLASYFGAKYAVACCSGTAGISMALLAAGVGPQDEVIVSPAAPVMTVLPIIAMGAVPIFVDMESAGTFALSARRVEEAITEKTKAVLSVPMWGYPIDTSALSQLLKKRSVCSIEDCSHAHGTAIAGQHQGSTTDIRVYSTQERKMICTGEGGYILSNEPEIAFKLHAIRNCGQGKSVPGVATEAGRFGECFGLNFRISGILAAIGCVQLERLQTRINVREKNGAAWRNLLQDVSSELKEFPVARHGSPNYYSFVAQSADLSSVREIAERLNAKGIISDTVAYRYKPLYRYPLFERFRTDCPNTEALCESILTLPVHEEVDADCFHVASPIVGRPRMDG